MTDGENNSGKIDPLTAAQAAQALGVKVYTIGVGKNGTAPMPVGKNPYTGETVYQDMPVDVDETRCKKSRRRPAEIIIARTTRKNSSKFTRRLTSWKKPRRRSANTRNTRNCFRGLSRADSALLLLEIMLAQTVFRRLP